MNLILPWASEESETSIKDAFKKVMAIRDLGREARDIADTWFFETVVRLHRAGEGAPYTGLKPAGLDTGPIIPKVENAIQTGDPKEMIRFITKAAEEELSERFNKVMATKRYDSNDVTAARNHVHRFLELTLYSHHLYQNISGALAHKQ